MTALTAAKLPTVQATYALRIYNGRYFASFGTLRNKRYTDQLCNYWTSSNFATVKTKALKLANDLGQPIDVINLNDSSTEPFVTIKSWAQK